MKRFSMKYEYDPLLDFNPFKNCQPKDPIKKALKQGKTLAALSRVSIATRKKNDPIVKAREEAEQRAEETIIKVVNALEMVLLDLNQTPTHSRVQKRVNQLQIHNAVFHLREKCGVKFSKDSEFSRKTQLDRQGEFSPTKKRQDDE